MLGSALTTNLQRFERVLKPPAEGSGRDAVRLYKLALYTEEDQAPWPGFFISDSAYRVVEPIVCN